MPKTSAFLHSLVWDDLRLLLAVADRGSLAAAGRAMRINHSTVLRRIQAIERRLGARLFDRSPGGYVLTAIGASLIPAAREIDAIVTDLERRVAGQDMRLDGTIRLSTTDTLAQTVVMQALVAFHQAHPAVRIELRIGNAMADLSRRDADVALRPSASPQASLVGRRISPLAFGLYASETYLARRPVAQPRVRDDWIGFDDSLADAVVARWMRKHLGEVVPAVSTNSLVAARDACAAGLGLAILPCYLGGHQGLLRPVEVPVADAASELWLLTHADLRGAARIVAFTDVMARALSASRDLFQGRSSA